MFKAYDKVERIEKEECSGILEGNCYIFEKIDGANASIYLNEETDKIICCSRTRSLPPTESFRGFVPYILEREDNLKPFLKDFIFYGEWLVAHKVKYAKEAYNKFYVFDIYDKKLRNFVHFNDSKYLYIESNLNNVIEFIKPDAHIENPSIDQIKPYLYVPSNYGSDFREGIVIKNYDFINKYGRCTYGKVLNEKFKEVKYKKDAEPNLDIEVKISEEYCTFARVDKICRKIKFLQVDKDIGIDYTIEPREEDVLKLSNRLSMKDIFQVINRTFYDIISEDMFDILKRFNHPVIDFKKLKECIFNDAKKHYNKFLESQV